MTPSTYIKLGVAASCLILLSVTHWSAYRSGANTVRLEWEQDKVAQMQAITAQEAAHRAQERKWGEATTLLWASLRDAQEALQDEYEAAIADMQSGTLRLRDDLRGCRAKLPSDSPTTTGDHGTGESGLSAARQSVALRIGAECDQVVNQLTAAQEYIKAIRPD